MSERNDSGPGGPITVYGADWCPDTKRVRTALTAYGVPFRYVNAEDDPAAEARIAGWNNGRAVYPTLDFGPVTAVNPTSELLKKQLQALGYLPVGG
jgi:thioredoxin reductase (NADPH)